MEFQRANYSVVNQQNFDLPQILQQFFCIAFRVSLLHGWGNLPQAKCVLIRGLLWSNKSIGCQIYIAEDTIDEMALWLKCRQNARYYSKLLTSNTFIYIYLFVYLFIYLLTYLLIYWKIFIQDTKISTRAVLHYGLVLYKKIK